jgi:hypothetical protein
VLPDKATDRTPTLFAVGAPPPAAISLISAKQVLLPSFDARAQTEYPVAIGDEKLILCDPAEILATEETLYADLIVLT